MSLRAHRLTLTLCCHQLAGIEADYGERGIFPRLARVRKPTHGSHSNQRLFYIVCNLDVQHTDILLGSLCCM